MNTTGGNEQEQVTRQEFEELKKRVKDLEDKGAQIMDAFLTAAGVFRSVEKKKGEKKDE